MANPTRMDYENLDKISYIPLADLNNYYQSGFITSEEYRAYIEATVAHIRRTILMNNTYQNENNNEFGGKSLEANPLD